MLSNQEPVNQLLVRWKLCCPLCGGRWKLVRSQENEENNEL